MSSIPRGTKLCVYRPVSSDNKQGYRLLIKCNEEIAAVCGVFDKDIPVKEIPGIFRQILDTHEGDGCYFNLDRKVSLFSPIGIVAGKMWVGVHVPSYN